MPLKVLFKASPFPILRINSWMVILLMIHFSPCTRMNNLLNLPWNICTPFVLLLVPTFNGKNTHATSNPCISSLISLLNFLGNGFRMEKCSNFLEFLFPFRPPLLIFQILLSKRLRKSWATRPPRSYLYLENFIFVRKFSLPLVYYFSCWAPSKACY